MSKTSEQVYVLQKQVDDCWIRHVLSVAVYFVATVILLTTCSKMFNEHTQLFPNFPSPLVQTVYLELISVVPHHFIVPGMHR